MALTTNLDPYGDRLGKFNDSVWDFDRAISNIESMTLNPANWPAQRKFLKWWLKQINGALLRDKKNIGKAIQVNIVGKLSKSILNEDVAKPQELIIEISALGKEEFNSMIMNKLKGKK